MARASGRKAWTALLRGLSQGADRAAGRVPSAVETHEDGGGTGSLGDIGNRAGHDLARLVGLERAVAHLPLFEREVWWLAARDGLANAEIAIRLGISVGEVARYLAAALVALAGALEASADHSHGG